MIVDGGNASVGIVDLAVSDIWINGHASKFAQLLPGLDMGGVICAIPCIALPVGRALHPRLCGSVRTRTVQITSMILAVSTPDLCTVGALSGRRSARLDAGGVIAYLR